MFEMKDEYLVGVELIDLEHTKLFEIAERAYQLYSDNFLADKYDYIIDIIDELRDYTILHFSDEEKYMESISYKRLFSHKIEHSEFIEKISNLNLREIDTNQNETILSILNFLNDWLVNHILYTDKLIAEAN